MTKQDIRQDNSPRFKVDYKQINYLWCWKRSCCDPVINARWQESWGSP